MQGGSAAGRRTTRNPAEQIAVEVSVVCDAWLAAEDDTAALADQAVRAALADARTLAAPAGARLVVGVVLTDDAEQRRLNRSYRGQDAPTNVLAFSLADPPPLGPPSRAGGRSGGTGSAALPAGAPRLLGDVVLAFETVAREAAEQGKPLADHLRHLVVHGVLHLLGFDHREEAAARLMERREIAILSRLGVPDPYRDTM